MRESRCLLLAASVSLHGARPWHLRESCSLLLARKRESPRRKAVASQRVVQLVASRERDSPRRKAVASKFEQSSSVSVIAHPRNGPDNSVENLTRTEPNPLR